MNGDERKSSKQEPGEERDWPEPSAPAPVCCAKNKIKNDIRLDDKTWGQTKSSYYQPKFLKFFDWLGLFFIYKNTIQIMRSPINFC